MAKEPLRPGNKAPISAQYGQYGPRGGFIKEVTSVKNHSLPPGPPGVTYKPLDPTKNNSGRR